ncbi:discoidin domain-containing protein [Kribbella sp. NBC_01505]|uniref:discoidin domain-containing protein n=1 Tax=Kribbella sp. NBC_01505 TaxID=2903580 RepID=UPI00386DBAC4
MIVCTRCGEHNEEAGTAFCTRCGVFLEWEGETAVATPTVDQPDSPVVALPKAERPADIQGDARQPQEAKTRRSPRIRPPVEAPTGSQICGGCGMPNQPDRHFCAGCGYSLAEATVVTRPAWWRRMLGRERRYDVGARLSSPGRVTRRLRTVFRAVLAGGVIAGIGALAGPYRSVVVNSYHSVQNSLSGPQVVRPQQTSANSTRKGHPASFAFDGATTTYWAPDKAKGPAVPWVRGVFAKPVKLVAVGITPGVSVQTPVFVAATRPAEIEVIVATDGGGSVVRKFTLVDAAGFQRLELKVPAAKSVQVAVVSSLGKSPTVVTAITELEFFAER